MMTFLKVALALVVVVIVIRTCINTIDPSKVESELNGQWSPLGTFSGSTDQVSSMYEVPSGKVRVKWFARNPEKRPGDFKLLAKDSQRGSVINDIAGVTVNPGAQRSGERAFAKAKNFYLEVQSTVTWEVSIESIQ